MLTTLLSFFVVLVVLILVHELGHFAVAKMARVKVEEFGIFMPPRLLSFKHGETIYSLNALPLGGFVRLSGEEDPTKPGSLAGKSIPVRLLTLGAGSLMNLLLPVVLLSAAFMVPHYAATNVGEVMVQAVRPDSPAEAAGIKAGDILVSADGVELKQADDYRNVIDGSIGREIAIAVRHRGAASPETVRLTPRIPPAEGEGETGVAIATVVKESIPFWEAIPAGVVEYWQVILLFREGILATFQGTVPFEVAGPVGIAQVAGEVARMGISPLLQFAAVISLNLGLVNILPLPALDGGRIVFVLMEWVRRGKRVSPQTERLVHTIGFFLLMLLILLATWQDVLRIMDGGRLGQ